MAKRKPKILKRTILDEIQIGGAYYTHAFEHLPKRRVRGVLYHRAWNNLGDRLHWPIVWKSRPRKLKKYEPVPYTYELFDTPECRAGRKAMFGIAIQLISNARTMFRIKGGWQKKWTEEICGDAHADSITGWRRRSMEWLKQHLGDWEEQAAETRSQAANWLYQVQRG